MHRRFLLGVTGLGILAALMITCLLLWPRASVAQRSPEPAATEPSTFASYDELAGYLREQMALAERLDGLYSFYGPLRAMDAAGGAVGAAGQDMAAPSAKAPAPDHSATNVQVAGVDEADIVKTDGKYLYVLTHDRIVILAAYPAEGARVLSRVEFPGMPREAFIAHDRLAVFGQESETGEFLLLVYDVTNRARPVLERTVRTPGQYVTSRLIGDWSYVVLNEPVFRAMDGAEKPALPRLDVDGAERVVPPSRIHYFDVPDRAYQYTVVLAVNVRDKSRDVTEKTFLTGVSQNIFASPDHIYLTAPKPPDLVPYAERFFDELRPVLPPELRAKVDALRRSGAGIATKLDRAETMVDEYLNRLDAPGAAALEAKLREAYRKWQEEAAPEIARQRGMTVIHKLGVDGAAVTYLGRGEVPGRVLNQFSMDEYRGCFRIATTSDGFSFTGPWVTRNNVYVLDKDMRTVGRLEGLAAGERIYAARFMGERCYLVTFRQVDPLFVIDLQDPANPRALGELKIPGYSNYLHPYDENHLLGIGKEIAEGREAGLKIALFDVRDPAHPKETAKYVIEGADADSPALRDHKTLLFSREKHLLAIPVSTYPPYRIMAPEARIWPPPPIRGWQGAYVFHVGTDGIKLKGKVQHFTDPRPDYAPTPDTEIKRCLYIEDVLYTVSDLMVKMNRLEDLKEINRVALP
ncbi:MAG: beta-propeller domain-containing protein [Bacillota bacterium]|nr:beta-propeller domain-containing protein [Bacillota bacterium]